jgi:hypothetical protein
MSTNKCSETIQGLVAGKICATPGALAALAQASVEPSCLLRRHLSGDWGELDDHDKAVNRQALEMGLRVMSSYRIRTGAKVWIITEADRSVTTVLLPSEY